jgi:hypothetical protein
MRLWHQLWEVVYDYVTASRLASKRALHLTTIMSLLSLLVVALVSKQVRCTKLRLVCMVAIPGVDMPAHFNVSVSTIHVRSPLKQKALQPLADVHKGGEESI